MKRPAAAPRSRARGKTPATPPPVLEVQRPARSLTQDLEAIMDAEEGAGPEVTAARETQPVPVLITSHGVTRTGAEDQDHHGLNDGGQCEGQAAKAKARRVIQVRDSSEDANVNTKEATAKDPAPSSSATGPILTSNSIEVEAQDAAPSSSTAGPKPASGSAPVSVQLEQQIPDAKLKTEPGHDDNNVDTMKSEVHSEVFMSDDEMDGQLEPEDYLNSIGKSMVHALLNSDPELFQCIVKWFEQNVSIDIGTICTGSGMAEIACETAMAALKEVMESPARVNVQFGCRALLFS